MAPGGTPRAASALRDAVKDGSPVIAALVLLNAVFVAIGALAYPVPATPGTVPPQSVSWWNFNYAAVQILIHVAAGFVVGALAGGLAKGLVGAAFGPLIDIDHLSVFLGTDSYARAGHSLVLLAALIFVVGLIGAWHWGRTDFAFFAVSQFTAHFAVAPPGFPLLSPALLYPFMFPFWVWAVATAVTLLAAWEVRFRVEQTKLE